MPEPEKRPDFPVLSRRAVPARFTAINRERLRRMRESLAPSHRLFLDVLPLLFHTNHALLPGYVSQSTPMGIADYLPSEQSTRAAQRLAKAFTLSRRAMLRFDILGMYLMGSCGTIAHSDHSDFDIWVCHASDLSEEGVEELRHKAVGIEQWALSIGVEAHFFVFDAERFKHGEYQQLSSESSGSTQHYLLIDEFYRSGLTVAGLAPIWLQVASEDEPNYEREVAKLTARRPRNVQNFIDFGGLARMPAEEFFGATLWQLYKSIDSPFKSVLKLLLMEVYATEYPNIDLLSIQFKRAVYSGEAGLNALDPYIAMYQRVEQYLQRRHESMRLDVLRRCFYLKIDEPLSRPPRARDVTWRREVLEEMVATWGWSRQKILHLDRRSTWKLEAVLEERRDLVNTITQCYRMLSQFARKQVELSRITQTDLNVLGRKLYSAFDRKAGKIELVNRGIAPSLFESEVSLHQIAQTEGRDTWALLRDVVPPDEVATHTPLKHQAELVEILTWGYFNRVIDQRTHIAVYTTASSLTVRETKTILGCLNELFELGGDRKASAQDLNEAPRLRTAALFVNVGVDPMKSKLSDGRHLASSRSNALSYGGVHQNLALTFDLVIESTWDEIFCFHYEGVRGLMDCICDYIRWAPPSKRVPPPSMQVFCHASSYSASIQNTLGKLFNDMQQAFYDRHNPATVRFVIEIEKRYYAVVCHNDQISHQEFAGGGALFRYLAAPAKDFVKTVIDAYSFTDRTLAPLFETNTAGEIQLFLLAAEKSVDIFVLDEHGSLFYQSLPAGDNRLIIQHFILFFESTNRRRLIHAHNEPAAFREPRLRILTLAKAGNGQRTRKEIAYTYDPAANQYFNIQVVIGVGADQERTVSIYCNDREFSSLALGAGVFKAVAGYVHEQRKSGQTYPIYITDIDFSREFLTQAQHETMQTALYLTYKKNIEDRLNEEIGKL